jgi:hypothetical protein
MVKYLVKNAIWQKGRDQQGEPQNKQGRRPATYIGGAAWEAGKGEQQYLAASNFSHSISTIQSLWACYHEKQCSTDTWKLNAKSQDCTSLPL